MKISNIKIDENELPGVDDDCTGNFKFMSKDLRKEELEEGEMIGIGTIINCEFSEKKINYYITRLHDQNQDSSLFEAGHYIWGIENCITFLVR